MPHVPTTLVSARAITASLFWAPLGRIGTVFDVTFKGRDLWAMQSMSRVQLGSACASERIATCFMFQHLTQTSHFTTLTWSLFWAPLGRIGTVFSVIFKGGDLWAMR